MVLGDCFHFKREVNDFGNYSRFWNLFSLLDIILTGGTWNVRGIPVYNFYNDLNDGCGQAALYFH